MRTRQVNTGLELAKERLKPFLRKYLEQHGVVIDQKGKFLCLNPEHEDTTPSMHFIPGSDEQKTKCFVCHASYDIFDVHTLLEGRPKDGMAFVYNNIYELADRFGVEIDRTEPTEQELLWMRLSRMYQDAAQVLVDMANESPEECLAPAVQRGLRPEICVQYGVACVPWRAFVHRMKACGHDVEMMKAYDIDKNMFDVEHLTFTIKNQSGMVVGFSRRYLKYDKSADKLARAQGHYYPPKYHNTSAKVPFFQRESLVYGLDTARKENYRRFDIIEGYTDVLSLRQVGLNNNGAGCGTGCTEGQLMQLINAGFTHFNWVADTDDAGLAAAMRFLDLVAGHEGIKATVTFLPFGSEVPESDRDPDGFIRWYGKDAYLALPEYSAFEWKLDNVLRQPDVDPLAVAKDMIPLLLNEKDRLERGRLIKALSDRTGVPAEDLRDEIKRRTDEEIARVGDALKRRLHTARDTLDIQRAIQEASLAAQESADTAVDISIEESARACIASLAAFKEPIHGIRGWVTGWEQFDQDFDGLVKEKGIFAIAGAPNCGKSAMLTNLACNLLIQGNEGVSVVYHIMDDPREIAFAKLMSCLTGIPIRHIVRAAADIMPYPHLKTAFENAEEWILEQVHTGKLVVKGQEMGTATDVATRLIDNVTQKTGNTVVYMGDSLHNLMDEEASDSERLKFTNIANWARRITDTRRMTMMFTCELTKEAMKGRPRLYMTAETRAIAYAFKAVGMLYNDLHVKAEEADTFWIDKPIDLASGNPVEGMKIRRPIIDIWWEKNKVSEFKGHHFWQFWDNSARVEQMTREDMQAQVSAARDAAEELKAPNAQALGSFDASLPYATPGLPLPGQTPSLELPIP